jgi:hypothetical protein
MRSVRAVVVTALVGGMGIAAGCGDETGGSQTKSPSGLPSAGAGGTGADEAGAGDAGTGGSAPSGGAGGSGLGPAGAAGAGAGPAGAGNTGGAGGGGGGGSGGQGGGSFQEPEKLGPGTCQTLVLQGTLGSSMFVNVLTSLDEPDLPERLGVGILSESPLPAPGVYLFASTPAAVRASVYEIGWYEGAPYGYLAETGYAVLEQVDSALESKGVVKDVRLRRCNWTYISTPEGSIRDKCVPEATGPCVYVAGYGWDTRPQVERAGEP